MFQQTWVFTLQYNHFTSWNASPSEINAFLSWGCKWFSKLSLLLVYVMIASQGPVPVQLWYRATVGSSRWIHLDGWDLLRSNGQVQLWHSTTVAPRFSPASYTFMILRRGNTHNVSLISCTSFLYFNKVPLIPLMLFLKIIYIL